MTFVQDRVAVGAVDDGGEIGVESHRVRARPQGEIRDVGYSFDAEVIERPAKFARRGKRAAQPFQRGHIGVRESVLRADGRLAGLIRLPWTKLTVAIDIAARLGNRKQRVEGSGPVETEIVHHEMVDRVFVRRLARVGGTAQGDEQGIVRANLADENRVFLGKILVGSVNERRASEVSRRRVDLQAVQLHEFYFRPMPQQARQTRVEGNVANLDQRRYVRAPLMAQHQSLNRNANPRIESHLEIVEVDAALETGLEVILRLLAGLGAQLRRHHVQSDQEREKKDNQGDPGRDNPLSHHASGAAGANASRTQSRRAFAL